MLIVAEIVVDVNFLPHSRGCQPLLINKGTSKAFEKFKFERPYSEQQILNHLSSF